MSTPFDWTGRDDGPGREHLRFWRAVTAAGSPGSAAGSPAPRSAAESADVAIVGFASDEGVRRNGGRVGAVEGPAAIRSALE